MRWPKWAIPTIVATLTVVAALLPMLFVSGLMGPYMSPIPANASAAMIFSFFVAVIVTPWLMMKIGGGRATIMRLARPHGGVLGAHYRAGGTADLEVAARGLDCFCWWSALSRWPRWCCSTPRT